MNLKLTAALLVSLAVAGLSPNQPRQAGADDVTVKTINPEQPADQPGNPNKAGPADQPAKQPDATAGGGVKPQPPKRPPWVNTGVGQVDTALMRAGLSEDQAVKIKAATDPFRKQYQESTKDLQAQFRETVEELTAFTVPGANVSREKMEEVRKRQQEAQRKFYDAGEKFRPDMEAQFIPLLTEAQIAKYQDAIEESSDTPAGRAKSRARMELGQYRAAELTEQQQTQVRDILAKAYEEFDTSHPDFIAKLDQLRSAAAKAKADGDAKAAKSARDEEAKLTKDYADARKASREQVDQVLTDEQRGKLKAEAEQKAKREIEQAIINVVLPLDKLDLANDQQQKVTALTDAARKALAGVGLADKWGRIGVAYKFKKDVTAVLTDAQKEKYAKATVVWTFGGKGQPDGTPTVQWKD